MGKGKKAGFGLLLLLHCSFLFQLSDGMGWGEGCLKDVPIVRPFQTQGGCDWWEKADDVKETRKNPDQSDHECVAVQQVHGQMVSGRSGQSISQHPHCCLQ